MFIHDENELAERIESFLWNSRFAEHNANNIWFDRIEQESSFSRGTYDFTSAILNMLAITSENPYNNLTELLNEDLGIVLNSDDPADLPLRSVGLQLMQDVCDTYNILPERVFWVVQNDRGLYERGFLMSLSAVAELLDLPQDSHDLGRYEGVISSIDKMAPFEYSVQGNNTLYITELTDLDEIRDAVTWRDYDFTEGFAASYIDSEREYPDFVDPSLRLSSYIHSESLGDQGFTTNDLGVILHPSHFTDKYASILGLSFSQMRYQYSDIEKAQYDIQHAIWPNGLTGVASPDFTRETYEKICKDNYIDVPNPIWIELSSKRVPDSDGFLTDYTLYGKYDGSSYICMFGDSDLYPADPSYADAEFESREEAFEWFDNYRGFEEEQDDISLPSVFYKNDFWIYIESESQLFHIQENSDGILDYTQYLGVESLEDFDESDPDYTVDGGVAIIDPPYNSLSTTALVAKTLNYCGYSAIPDDIVLLDSELTEERQEKIQTGYIPVASEKFSEELKNYYFTFGPDNGDYPFNNGYVRVRASSTVDAQRVFKYHYPDPDGLLRCEYCLTEEEWLDATDEYGNYRGGGEQLILTEPFLYSDRLETGLDVDSSFDTRPCDTPAANTDICAVTMSTCSYHIMEPDGRITAHEYNNISNICVKALSDNTADHCDFRSRINAVPSGSMVIVEHLSSSNFDQTNYVELCPKDFLRSPSVETVAKNLYLTLKPYEGHGEIVVYNDADKLHLMSFLSHNTPLDVDNLNITVMKEKDTLLFGKEITGLASCLDVLMPNHSPINDLASECDALLSRRMIYSGDTPDGCYVFVPGRREENIYYVKGTHTFFKITPENNGEYINLIAYDVPNHLLPGIRTVSELQSAPREGDKITFNGQTHMIAKFVGPVSFSPADRANSAMVGFTFLNEYGQQLIFDNTRCPSAILQRNPVFSRAELDGIFDAESGNFEYMAEFHFEHNAYEYGERPLLEMMGFEPDAVLRITSSDNNGVVGNTSIDDISKTNPENYL